jgi:hypothetical protein
MKPGYADHSDAIESEHLTYCGSFLNYDCWLSIVQDVARAGSQPALPFVALPVEGSDTPASGTHS